MNMQDTLGLEEAAEFLKVNPETVRRLADGGDLLGAKIGVSWVFLRADLMEYLRAEARRQTEERRERAEAMLAGKITGQRVKTACSVSRGAQRKRKRPDLDELEKMAAA